MEPVIKQTRIGIVGAGIAGLACAEQLVRLGAGVSLFDKGRRPGGRMTALHLEQGSWDLGAQYFAVRHPAFAQWLAGHQVEGRIAPWASGPPGAMVAVPGMDSLAAAVAAKLDVTLATAIDCAWRDRCGWWIAASHREFGPFDALAIAVSAEQAAPLLAMQELGLAREAVAARSQPCWSVAVSFAQPLAGVRDYLRGPGAVAWAARNSSKPGRPAGECWVLQASPGWSRQRLDWPPDRLANALLGEFAALAGIGLPSPTFLKAHRWRFAMATGARGGALWDPALAIGACGDWCSGARVEDAWLSGIDLAGRIAADVTSGATAQAHEFITVEA
jgi:predicted NAD/FAD-dependent oxidoreductase